MLVRAFSPGCVRLIERSHLRPHAPTSDPTRRGVRTKHHLPCVSHVPRSTRAARTAPHPARTAPHPPCSPRPVICRTPLPIPVALHPGWPAAAGACGGCERRCNPLEPHAGWPVAAAGARGGCERQHGQGGAGGGRVRQGGRGRGRPPGRHWVRGLWVERAGHGVGWQFVPGPLSGRLKQSRGGVGGMGRVMRVCQASTNDP